MRKIASCSWTVILRGRAGYELIYITNEAAGYYQLISGKSENNCFSKFSSNSLHFFGLNLLKSWHFLYRRRREKFFSDLQNFSTRFSPSVFPYLVKLNDNGSYHGLRELIRKLENHYPKLKIFNEYYLTIISHASFSEREGDWGSECSCPAWWKKIERERSHVGHACQPSIRIVMPGMKMNEMSCKKRTKE